MSNKFTTHYRIYYEDTDAGGVVYYANYLKFFERARTDFLRSLAISQSDLMQSHNLAFVVRKCDIDYLSPATLDDMIEVSVKITEIRNASILMDQTITIGDKVLSSLKVKIASVNVTDFKPTKIPDTIKQLITNTSSC